MGCACLVTYRGSTFVIHMSTHLFDFGGKHETVYEPSMKVYYGIRTKRPQLNGTPFLIEREQ